MSIHLLSESLLTSYMLLSVQLGLNLIENQSSISAFRNCRPAERLI
ncbi:hypothetical protein NEOC65_001660 [Neochlamydia sp. AcF65]|nr:hypothetical protein [Neochlamydia sp. AcF65]MBS4170466.1 hypothetical protein [Neochlamydia sp. AcF95]